MLENSLAMLLLALPLMGSPGPAIVSLAATGSAFGFKSGFRYLLGIMIGNSTVILMIAAGITGAVLAIPGAVPVLTVIGLAYLLYLSYRIATAPVTRTAEEMGEAPTAAGGFLMSLVNPKAYAAIGAVYASASIAPEQPLLDTLLKIILLICINICVNSTWLAIGSAFSSVLRNPKTGRAMNYLFAALVILSVVLTVLR